MARLMLFIDGTWLYTNVPRVAEGLGKPGYRIDYGRLPAVLAEQARECLGVPSIDVVRTHVFGSYAVNHDPRDTDAVQRRRDFLALLRDEHRQEVEAFPVDFRGRRVRRADRDADDPFRPEETCVDVALATALLLAATSGALDVALVVTGSAHLVPALQAVRRLGRRVVLASVRAGCAHTLADARDEARVRDADTIWLEEHADALELRFEPIRLECTAPDHQGDRLVWSTWHPRRGQRFLCPECLARQRAQRAEGASEAEGGEPGQAMRGTVRRRIVERRFGFIAAEDGADYFFHASDLCDDLCFDELPDGQALCFEVRRRPSAEGAGAAQRVRPGRSPDPAGRFDPGSEE